MIKINVITKNPRWYRFIKNPKIYIDKKIEKLNNKTTKFKNNKFFCSLLLSGNKEIKNLNKKFKKKDKVTDVLSFPFYTKKDLQIKLKKEKEIYLGDIIVNLDKINIYKNLIIFKNQFNKLWIHGFVHLFGYDHKKDKDFKKMNKVEKDYLKYIN